MSDGNNHTIRKLTPLGIGWAVTTLAGAPGESGSTDGTNTDARFTSPYGLALDSATNIYVADNWSQRIRKITPDGVVTTLAGDGHEGNLDGPRPRKRPLRCPPPRRTADQSERVPMAKLNWAPCGSAARLLFGAFSLGAFLKSFSFRKSSRVKYRMPSKHEIRLTKGAFLF